MLCLVSLGFAAWATTRTQWLLFGIKPHPYEIKNANQQRKYDGPKRRRKHWMTLRVGRKIVIVVSLQSACPAMSCLLSFFICVFVCVCVCVFAFAQNMTASCSCACALWTPHLGGRATNIFKSLLHWFSLAFSFCRDENGSFTCCFFNFCGIWVSVVFFHSIFIQPLAWFDIILMNYFELGWEAVAIVADRR